MMARWLSWLERRPVTAEVVGSNPIRVAFLIYLFYTEEVESKKAFSSSFLEFWDLSSAGRASALQAGGHRFEPCRSHLYMICTMRRCGGTGRRAGLKILLWQHSTGSIPVTGIKEYHKCDTLFRYTTTCN